MAMLDLLFPSSRCLRRHQKAQASYFFRVLGIVIGAFSFPVTAGAAPVISEFLADNDGGLRDEDGEDQDWIEIHNPDAAAVDLAGWRLTDDPARLSKWVFPPYNLPAGGRLIVWASEKDRDAGQLHTNFKLDQDGEYLALISPSGTVSTEFAPVFPFQTANVSYGRGFGGTVTSTVISPLVPVGGTHFSRIKITGVGTAAEDGSSLNSFDDGLAQPQHQQYLWFDYSGRLGNLPAGQTVVEALLEWTGTGGIFAGVSGLNCVPTNVGIFAGPKNVAGIALTGNGNDLVNYYAANTPYTALTITPGEQKSFLWNVTQLVRDWLAAPAAPGYGQFLILPGAHPSWIQWDQNGPPKLTVRTVNSATPVSVWGHMAVTPGNANTGATAAGPLVRQLTENPPVPPAGADLKITARVEPLSGAGGAVATVQLSYRRAYDAEVAIGMLDDGNGADTTAGDSIYSAFIPAASIQAGQMIRWRLTAIDASGYQTKMPPYRNTVDSPQYFGTVPANPAITTPLMVLHRFVQNPAAANTATGTRASLFLNGEFYDNVGINIHGQSTTGSAFLKKSYDIDGNRGYRFKWTDDPLVPRAKDINLLTIYPDKTRIRHDLAYEMNREAGVAAHYCFLTHVRLNGTFDGIYDFVEDADDVYLERAGLNKDGALYKMYNNMLNPATDAITGAEKKNRKFENNSDLYNFEVGMNLTDVNAQKAFLFDNVDIPKMINFMAANTTTGNVDLHAKNYYVYCDTGKTNLWTLLPWDLDLSQGRLWTSVNNYFDDGMYLNAGGTLSGRGQGLVSRMYAVSEFSLMARRRIRSLQDKFWKGATPVVRRDLTRWYDRRVNEIATVMGASWTVGQNDTPGMDAALDYARYPAAAWRNPAPATTPSPFAAYTMSQEIQRLMDTYVVQRINTINSDGNVPPAYNLNTLTPLTFSAVEHSPASGDQDQEFIEITNPNNVAVDLSGWQITGGVTFTFEPGTVVNANNKIYVAASRNAFKTRTVSPKGGESRNVVGGYQGHLSNLGETINLLDDTGTQRATTTYTGSASPQQQYLAVTEVMYHPPGTGLAEFIEVTNISSSVTVSMEGVRLTNAVDFNFTGSAITSLAPGGRALVVRDMAAFTAAYGNGLPVAGAFANTTALSNGGELVKFEDPSNNTIKEFTYDDVAPWPAADGTGASLVLIRPESNPDPALPQNWRASAAAGGNPGGTDALPFTGDPAADDDHDGLTALLEYVFGTSDNNPGRIDLQPARGSENGEPFLEITVTRQINADDAAFSVESSTNLTTWSSTGWSVRQSLPRSGGLVTEIWRLSGGDAAGSRLYVRCRCTYL
jgi:CotH kinase protein/Lamin Tail Domain